MKKTTKLLYLLNSYLKDCKTVVKSLKTKGEVTEVILTETVFYPQGGGQPCDQGSIKGKDGELVVTNVAYNNGIPLHQGKLRGRLKEGESVECRLNWERRYRNMQLHSAGHLVHEAVHEAHPQLKPLKAVHGIAGELFVEYQGSAELDLPALNVRLFQLVQDDRSIEHEFLTLKQLKSRAQFVPENLPTNKRMRIVTIDGFEPIPDGGTQVRSTLELAGTVVTSLEVIENGIRVHYKVPAVKPKASADEKEQKQGQSTKAVTVLLLKSVEGSLNNAISLITSVKTPAELEELRIKYLGRKGEINRMLEKLSQITPQERAATGEAINDLKRIIEEAIVEKSEKFSLSEDLYWVDLTAPGIRPPQGHLHLVTQAIMEITRIFERIGFTRARHPEVDWDWYAFESLNMPPESPARDEWETFFINSKMKNQNLELENKRKYQSIVLTPHTSNGQVREMEKRKLPIRMINIAKCYRRQSDISHTPMFHQFEGLYIDKDVSIGHLKGVVDYFIKQYFGSKRLSRLRPFHFQFTEPSFEIDISCDLCHGRGCKLCKDGWLELAGAGMVHPTVLKNGGINPSEYNGWAFGWGVERVAMMRSGTKLGDIRLLYSNDVRFLEQF